MIVKFDVNDDDGTEFLMALHNLGKYVSNVSDELFRMEFRTLKDMDRAINTLSALKDMITIRNFVKPIVDEITKEESSNQKEES